MTPSNLRYPVRPGPRQHAEPWREPDRTERYDDHTPRPLEWGEFRHIDPREALIALLVIVVIVLACSLIDA